MLGARLSDLTARLQRDQAPGIRLELEAKFGSYGKGFNSTVHPSHFERLKKLLTQKTQPTIEDSTVYIAGTSRQIVYAATGENVKPIIAWEHKEALDPHIEIPEYGVRVSLNREWTIQAIRNFRYKDIRKRTRYSFSIFDGNVRADLTEVTMSSLTAQGRATQRFEVEFEFVGPINNLPIFDEALLTIFTWLYDTALPYTIAEKQRMIDDVNQILESPKGYNIDKSTLVEARNLKKADLTYGALVQQPGQELYTVTHKTDGVRKMLILHNTGVWLVYPPFEYNLVSRFDFGNATGTILDGELVPVNRRKAGAPTAQYWFIYFDCMALLGSRNIQDQPHGERVTLAKRYVPLLEAPLTDDPTIVGTLRNETIHVDDKTFISLSSVDDFYRVMKQILDERNNINYYEDGLVFIPERAPYNPHSEVYPLHQRVLSKHPDVCKWKGLEVTIDFDVSLRPDGLLLQVFDKMKGELVPFTGDQINPFTPAMFVQNHELTQNLRQANTIIEYRWQKVSIPIPGQGQGSPLIEERMMLVPYRPRPEKHSANRLDVALDNWKLINDPITEGDLRGESFSLLRRYHNRIKRGLYNILPKGSTLLDIGTGNGGDFPKWSHLSKVVTVEPDAENRAEAERRAILYNVQQKVRIVSGGGEDTTLITQAVGEHIGRQVDAVSLMLSLSFFWKNSDMLQRLVETIRLNLKPDGIILFLTVNGDAVEQIFEPVLGGIVRDVRKIGPSTWTIGPRTRPPNGRLVHISLPGTIVGEQDEYLVRLADLQRRLLQLKPINQKPVSQSLSLQLEVAQRADGERFLSRAERDFTVLYSYGHFRGIRANVTPLTTVGLQLPAALPVSVPVSPPIPPIEVVLPEIPVISNLPGPTLEQLGEKIGTDVNSGLEPIKEIKSRTGETGAEMTQRPISPVAVPPPLPLPTQVPPRTEPLAPNLLIPTAFPGSAEVNEAILPYLPVDPPPGGFGPARGDDVVQQLRCSWYQEFPIVRIATIGDGSCFVHSYCKGFFPYYQENNDYTQRVAVVANLRRDLGLALTSDNPDYPGFTYWATAANGGFVRRLMQELRSPELVREAYDNIDYSVAGLQGLLNSNQWLGEETYDYFADIIGVDIFVLLGSLNDLRVFYTTARVDKERPIVAIMGNKFHYETVGLQIDGAIQTVFPRNHPFVQTMIGRKGLNENHFDPLGSFVRDVDETFRVGDTYVFPENLREMFVPTDPFIIMLEQAAQLLGFQF
jgi:SAM-dependent methyltransferase